MKKCLYKEISQISAKSSLGTIIMKAYEREKYLNYKGHIPLRLLKRREKMNKWLELLLGLILVVVPIVVAINMPSWSAATIEFLKGGIVVGVILIGLLFIMLGISDMKD